MIEEINTEASEKTKIGVLIVEPDSSARAFYCSTLSVAGGFAIWSTATLKEALELFDQIYPEKISIIVFDITNKDFEGHLLLQKIREHPGYFNKGILICSDKLSSGDKFLLSEMQVQHFIPRKVDSALFVEMIHMIDREVQEQRPITTKLKELENSLRSRDTPKCNAILSSPELANSTSLSEMVPLRAEVMLANHDVEKAIDILKQFLQQEAKAGKAETFKALNVFGKALCMANRYDEALGIFQRLAEKSPNNLMHKINIGEVLLGKGDISGAESKFREVLEQDPGNIKAQVGIGGVKLAEGDSDGAISLFEKMSGSIESYSLASFFNNAAIALSHRGKNEDAIDLYKNAMRFFDKYKVIIYFNMGMAQLKMGHVKFGCECFDKVFKLENGEFIETKSLLREYRDLGLEHMLKKYSPDQKE